MRMTSSEARSRRRQLGLDALWVAALMVSVAVAACFFASYLRSGHLGGDARAYWLSGHTDALYNRQPKQWGAYLYSPAFAEAVRPLTLLPLGVFCVGWIAAEAAVYAWLLAPLGRWAPVAFLWCTSELCWGNVYAWFALVTVIGFRRPWAWAFPALTKIVPAQGILWFAVRREWRSLGIALGSTLAVAAVSFAIAPHLWVEWYHFLRSASPGPFAAVRFAGACGVTVLGALTGRRWLLAPAMALACPVFNVSFAVAVLAALPRLRAHAGSARAVPPPVRVRAHPQRAH
jgi:hypothetical protein